MTMFSSFSFGFAPLALRNNFSQFNGKSGKPSETQDTKTKPYRASSALKPEPLAALSLNFATDFEAS